MKEGWYSLVRRWIALNEIATLTADDMRIENLRAHLNSTPEYMCAFSGAIF